MTRNRADTLPFYEGATYNCEEEPEEAAGTHAIEGHFHSGTRISVEDTHRARSLCSSTHSMPSLFSRSRTTSTPHKANRPSADDVVYDEFGRVSSRSSNRGVVSLPGKKDNKKDKDARARTFSTAKGRASTTVDDDEPPIPDGSFLPLTIEPPRRADPEGGPPREREQDYGYLSYQRHVVLGLDEADRLVRTLTDELGSRGLTTPFIFSSLALDISAAGVRRLVQAFLRTCVPFPAPDADKKWNEEAKFAGPHELGMCLRWGLARVVRIVGGNAVRGLVGWENYIEWSEAEVGASGVLKQSSRTFADLSLLSSQLSSHPLCVLFGPFAARPALDYHQYTHAPCALHCTFRILRSHAAHSLATIRSSSFWPRPRDPCIPPCLCTLPSRDQRHGAPSPRIHTMARCTDERLE